LTLSNSSGPGQPVEGVADFAQAIPIHRDQLKVLSRTHAHGLWPAIGRSIAVAQEAFKSLQAQRASRSCQPMGPLHRSAAVACSRQGGLSLRNRLLVFPPALAPQRL